LHPPIKDFEGRQVRNDNVVHALFIELIPRNSAKRQFIYRPFNSLTNKQIATKARELTEHIICQNIVTSSLSTGRKDTMHIADQ
jgi:hypothetical protein